MLKTKQSGTLILLISILIAFSIVGNVQAAHEQQTCTAAKSKSNPLDSSIKAACATAEGGMKTCSELCCCGIKICAAMAEGARDLSQDLLVYPNRLVGVKELAPSGLTFSPSMINLYQQNTKGGLSTHNKRGRFFGYYNLELAGDLQRLLGWEGASFYMKTEGAYSQSGGINTPSVGGIYNTYTNAKTRRAMDIIELWYQQAMFDGTLRLRIGKTPGYWGFGCNGRPAAFAANTYASDWNTQFLNYALNSNNIPFAQNGLGAALFYNPIPCWYAAVAVNDDQADFRETGFRTTFHDEDAFIYIAETGIVPSFDSKNGPLKGAYRFGLWYDPSPKSNADDTKLQSDDVGFYTSCDQLILKENDDPNDDQGLGVFGKYSYADSRKNNVTNFISFGFQYKGLIEGRDNDVLGVGFARGVLSDRANSTYTDNHEDVYEIYYNTKLTNNISLTPSLQYIKDPGANDTADDAVIVSMRLYTKF